MTSADRRKFLAVAGAGAAAGTVAMAVTGRADAASPAPGRAQEPVLAIVEDHTGDAVRLLVGEHEVTVHDRDLVTRLLNAAGGQ